MAFDGLFLHAMTKELNKELAGGRITKIAFPFPYEIIMTVRSFGKNRRLLLSAHPVMARAQITKVDFENPLTAPNFVMVLRRYLQGGKILGFQQVENDRILKIMVANANEIGDAVSYELILEIMGRHSNLFLLDSENKIVELIKHVPAFENRVRILMPGAQYSRPPKQDLIDPFKSSQFTSSDAHTLANHYQGMSKVSAKEATKSTYLTDWFKKFDQADPTLTKIDEQHAEFTAFPYSTLVGQRSNFSLLSDLLDAYYVHTANSSRVHALSSQIDQIIKNELHKNQRKLRNLNDDLAKTDKAESDRIKGELLTAYQNKIVRGQETVTLDNYYDNSQLTISLDPKISANANAQKYFTKYQKLKKSVQHLDQQIKLTAADLDYFETIDEQLKDASPKDLDQIKLELLTQGFLKDRKISRPSAKKRSALAKPDRFKTTDGISIEVGKNNFQNDELSLKTARKDEIWLHVQKLPGSHVILHSNHPSDNSLVQAAKLAAYFSKAKNSANVAVDYLPAGKLHKPNGAKPGFVIFEGQQTIFVTPDSKLVERLKA
ncbi:fibronectin/fibrinogen-binding protein [Oenococcus sicerae]|uniref:Rqc2 homolog RqcH n=1 Tax=Oenococcus sicerae TaxID=2203724 RepID=A0AAJ1RBD4_9LACO|nr:NFACT RNA binding domain-containing protein [Oenococcus sicerae]MDN6899805.1 fibronectin/fibrinogen-binding protein [Oenococcus sicerae]QAS70491.1 fibronectin/fibrinogen-binding protein [Oenococcus sicerae]